MERLEHWEELEKITLDENSNRYRRVKKALFGDPSGKIKTFAIISPENPLGLKDSTDEEWLEKYRKWSDDKSGYNRDAIVRLKKELLADRIEKNGDDAMSMGGFNYVQIKGKYGANEKTFIIFNISLADAKIIARDYGQESFFWGRVANTVDTNSTIGYYVTSNNCKTYDLVEVSNTIYDESDATDFFSKYGFKYRIAMREFGDDVPEITDTKEFEESFDENRTFMSRALHRKRAYHAKSLEENSSTRVKSALFDRTHRVRTFAILTAENPNNTSLSAAENNSRMKSLKKTLRDMRINYVKIDGMYNRKEHSVLATNITLSEAEELAKNYGQESFFFGDEGGIYYYERDDADSDYILKDKSNNVTTQNDADNFFSRHGDFKFSIDMDYFNQKVDEGFDIRSLDKSLRNKCSEATRIKYRNIGGLFTTPCDYQEESKLFSRRNRVRTLAILELSPVMKCSKKELERELAFLQLLRSSYITKDKHGNNIMFIANCILGEATALSDTVGCAELYYCSEQGMSHYYKCNGSYIEDKFFDGVDSFDCLLRDIGGYFGEYQIKEAWGNIIEHAPVVYDTKSFERSFDESLTCQGRVIRRVHAFEDNGGGINK